MSPDRSTYIDSPGPVVDRLRALFASRPPAVIFDIGSCEGEDAVRYARAFPEATIYAAEPLPENLEHIRTNIETRDLTNVVVIPVAFSDRAGTAELHVSSGRPPGAVGDEDWDYGNKSSSLLAPDQHLVIHPWVAFDRTEIVPTQTVDAYCTEAGIDDIDFIHLDVQGAELRVLEGAGRRLERTRAIWLEVEAIPLYAGQPLKPDVEAFMAAQGFALLVDTVGRVSGDQLYVRSDRVDMPVEAAAGAGAGATVGGRSGPVRSVRRRLRPLKRAGKAAIRATREIAMLGAARRERRHAIAAWKDEGRPVPPPHIVKEAIVAAYARRFGLDRLVETGTFKGDMVEAQRRLFRRIVSIELDDTLFDRATRRFRRYPHVEIVHGDSEQMLAEIVPGIEGACLYWLDAHFSGAGTARGTLDTPIVEELRTILRSGTLRDVILIDDARLFGADDYPSVDELRRKVTTERPDWIVVQRDDVIRIHAPVTGRGRRWLPSRRGSAETAV